MKKLFVGLASLTLVLTACGQTVSNTNIPSKNPASATTKVLFQDPINRYALLTNSDCPLSAKLEPRGADDDALFTNDAVIIGTTKYARWFQYHVLSKTNYEQYIKKYEGSPEIPSQKWILKDQSYLITFPPSEGPSDETIVDCTVSVEVK